MLARANRVIRADEFRTVVRRGRRVSTPAAVYYLMDRSTGDPARFGFIVSRAVGPAVDRNRVKRRLRAITRELVDAGASGRDVVVRVHQRAVEQSWQELRMSTRSALAGEVTR